MIYAATGPRPLKIQHYYSMHLIVPRELQAFAYYVLGNLDPKPTTLITGMAQGWDSVTALAALGLGIPVHCYVPFLGHAEGSQWDEGDRKIYQTILDGAAKVHVVTKEFPASSSRTCKLFNLRNTAMVDNTEIMLALYRDTGGGTLNCLDYARQRRVPIVNVHPEWEDWKFAHQELREKEKTR